jgi:CRP/FNR family transcriptional regulator, cyclic AMP receptor protein
MIASQAAASIDSGSFLLVLSDDEQAALRERGVVRRFARGVALFHERQGSDRVLVVLDGRVKVGCTSEDGREVVLAIRGPGDLLGELSAIDGEPRLATATALEPVEALVVPAADFNAFLLAHPNAALHLLRMLSRRLRDADRKRVEFAAQDTLGRVAARLVEMCERFGEPHEGGTRIDLPISQEELAGWTGSSREAVSKALQAMRELGWIETRRRQITVQQLDAIRRRAF